VTSINLNMGRQMSRTFPQALFAVLFAICITVNLSATTYYVAANGNDSNNGTSKSAPWAHLPGMRTWAGSHTPVAGDTFILRGCDDWGNSNFPINWTWSGSSGSPITIDRDTTWYNTANCSSWNRAKFDAQSTVINPPECSNNNAFWEFGSSSYVDANWIELINYYWTSSQAGGSCGAHEFWVSSSSSASHLDLANWYVHRYTPQAGAGDIDHGFLGGCETCYVDYMVADNSDGLQYTGIGMQWPTRYSIFKYVSNAIKPHMSGEYAYDNISHLGLSGLHDGTHPNCIETIGPIQGSGNFYIHDNLIHDMPNSPTEQCETLQVGNTGETDYVWNNVFYNLGGGDIARLPQNDQPNVNALYFINNTWEEDAGSVCAALNSSSGGANWINAFVMVNNHCITSSTPSGDTQSQKMMTGTVSGPTKVLFSNNVVETIAAANSSGYSNAQTYVYSPPSASGGTVGAGTNLASTYWPSGFSPNDSSYSCSEQTVSGVVESVCPARTPNPRPAAGQGAWDAGAYEFGSSGTTVNPPTGLAAIVQ
jgi:hypothetical protein